MSRHRYSLRAVTADYLRAGGGMTLTFGPLAAIQPGPIASAVLGGLGAVFLLFGVRTLLRHLARVELSEDGISSGTKARLALRWRALESLKLGFFPTKRDRSDGWMQLKLKGGGRRLSFDSHLEGFDVLVERAVEAARANGVELGLATQNNLAALGIAPVAQPSAPMTEVDEERAHDLA